MQMSVSVESLQTPRRTSTPGRTPSRPTSPARQTRLEEKNELADLNKRLEFYIVNARQRDASVDSLRRELEAVRAQAERDKLNAQLVMETHLRDLRASRDKLLAQVQDLLSQLGSKDNALRVAGTERGSSRQLIEEMEVKLTETQRELTSTKASLFSAEEKVKQLRADYEAAAADAEDARTQLEESKQRALDAAASEAAAVSRAASVREDFETYKAHTEPELARYRQQVQELAHANARAEDEIRKEFKKQLEELFLEKRREWESEKEEGLAELKRIYDDKIAAYRNKLEEIGHEAEAERQKNAQMKRDMLHLKTQAEAAISVRHTLEARVAELSKTLAERQAAPSQELKQKNEIIRQIKAAFARKDREFDELMDVKIALAMEIKAYRALLEQEEDRLGIQSPLKKRKRADGSAIGYEQKEGLGLETPMGSRAPATPGTALGGSKAFVISGMDIHGQFLTIRNSTTSTGTLAGWKLRSQMRPANEFKFPSNTRLRPGETFKFRTLAADGSKPGAESEPDAWIPHDFWDPRGDMAELVNPMGITKVLMEIVGEAPEVPVTPAHSAASEEQAGEEGSPAAAAPASAFPSIPATPAPKETAFSFDSAFTAEGSTDAEGVTAATAAMESSFSRDNMPEGFDATGKKGEACIVM